MIGFIDAFFTFSLNHNQLQQLTINDCLRLAPFSFSFLFESESESESESELLYDWWFTVNRFVLVPSPLRLKARFFFFN
jgi:hypothetical protein